MIVYPNGFDFKESHIYLMEDYILHDMIINRLIGDKGDKDKIVQMMQEVVRKIKE